MIKGLLKLSNSILCKKEVLGKAFECKIGGIKASIHFPQFPIVDDSKPQIGISNPLLAPEIGRHFSDHGDPLFWGIPVSYPDGNSSVNRLVISVECEETQNKDRAKVLYESYEQWVYSFIIYLMLETEYGALLEPLASVTIEPLKSVRQSHKNREILCQNGRRLPGAHTQNQSSSFFGLSESPLKIIL